MLAWDEKDEKDVKDQVDERGELGGRHCDAGPSHDPFAATVVEGDLAVVLDRYVPIKLVSVTQDGTFQTRSGLFKMKDWIGKEWGTRIMNEQGKDVMVVKPTPELWTRVLTHRTQILYLPDISMVLLKLEVKPGCVVLETGTGTGSLSTSLARAVHPTGKLYTFEYHHERAAKASEDFKRHGMDHIVEVGNRDTQTNGFPEEFHGRADAVFLDLPTPWLAVKSAHACLKPDKMLCSFSPCIEQVQRTLEELNEYGFFGFETIEILTREHLLIKETEVSMIDVLYEQRDGTVNGKEGRAEGTGAGAARKRGRQEEGARGTRASAISRPEYKTRGHTGYLTFCRKPVPV
jgi:tRNA (adenine57-N1/adenine58-N1)-methyltransferase catalytic subunit